MAELAAGIALLALATFGGMVVAARPWPNRFDRIGFQLLPHRWSAWWAVDTVHLLTMPFVVAAAVVLCVAAVALQRDLFRAVACVLGPLAAVVVSDDVAKPLVGRHFVGTTALSYPSGTVAVAAALVVAAVLVAPRIVRPLVAGAGFAGIVIAAAAVVILRWHYPTDAVGGACIGAGAILTLDAGLHVASDLAGLGRDHRRTSPQPSAAATAGRRSVLGSAGRP